MSETQDLFAIVWSYMPYLIPTLFIFSFIAFSDLFITLIVSIVKKARKTIRW